MSMPSSLIGFAIFKALRKSLGSSFTPIENGTDSPGLIQHHFTKWYHTVLVQTVAVAAGPMPLSAGFVGVIPALEKLLRVHSFRGVQVSSSLITVFRLGCHEIAHIDPEKLCMFKMLGSCTRLGCR